MCANTVHENSEYFQDLNELAAQWIFSPMHIQFLFKCRNSAEASIEDTFPMAYVDASTMKFVFCEFFLVVPFCACHKKVLRKAVLEKTYLALGRWLLVACLDLSSCFCLVRASKPTVNQLMQPLPTTRLVSLSAWHSCAHTMGLFLESLGSQAQLCRKQHFGVLKKNFLPSTIGVQQCAGLFLVILGRLACGHKKSANLLPEGSQKHVLSQSAFLHACLVRSLLAFLQSPCRSWVMNSY